MGAKLSRLCVMLLLAGASASGAPDLPAYSLTDLKALGIWPVAMNGHGEVVGTACCGRQSAGVLLYAASQVSDIGLPPGGYSSFTPKAINETGWIVGNAWLAPQPAPDWEQRSDAAFHDGAAWTVIDASSLGPDTDAVGINDAGQVVGNSRRMLYSNTAWLYAGGRLVQLGPTANSTATDISDAGQIVGYLGPDYSPGSIWSYRDGEWRDLQYSGVASAVNEGGTILAARPGGPGIGRSAYLVQDGAQYYLPKNGCWPWVAGPGERRDFYAVALNERDEVAGFGIHACLYGAGASLDLGTLGGSSSRPQSLSNRSQVAGWSTNLEGRPRPFVYDGGAMLDLADLRGVGSALQLGNANELRVAINDESYLLVIATDTTVAPVALQAAYLLTPVTPSVTLATAPATVQVRRPVTLTWSSQNANSCVATGGVAGDGWAGGLATSGQKSVSARQPGQVPYGVRCTAGTLSGEAAATVIYTKKSGGGVLDVLSVILLGLGAGRRRAT